MKGERRASILWRVVLLHLLALIAVTLAVVATSYFVLNSTVNEFERGLLLEHAKRVEPFVSHASGRWTVRLPEEVLQIFSLGHGGYVLAVVDRDAKKWGQRLAGIPVISPEALIADPRGVSVVVSSYASEGAIARALVEKGIAADRIVTLYSGMAA